jgi:cysteinyl-tRNA synthetase
MSNFLTEILKTLERSHAATQKATPPPHFAVASDLANHASAPAAASGTPAVQHGGGLPALSTHPQSSLLLSKTSCPMIRIYNTLTKNKEIFEPVVPGKAGIYLCGPTVYKESHIGHMVGPVIFDTIKRYLVYSGYDVTWVVNITDVDDKLIQQQHERGVPMAEIAEEMIVDYLNNLRSLGVDQIDHMPRATEYMGEIIAMIESLIANDHAYAVGGDVFFDVAKDPGYGKLSNRSADEQQGEGGGHAAKKRSPGDFALWKSAKPGEPSWDSPWGAGRPGWHIECSAMSRGLLGETFDIHGGGLDLMFPHHENEIAQSECCHNKPMVKYWLHNGLLRAGEKGKVGGRSDREAGDTAAAESVDQAAAGKISRSKGGGGLADVIAQQGGERIRFFLLKSHYRSTVVYDDEALKEAATALESFYRYFERFQKITKQRFYNLPPVKHRDQGELAAEGQPLLAEVARLRTSFLEKMDDDFNTGGAIADLFDMVRELNKYIEQQKLEEVVAQLDKDDEANKTKGSAVRDGRVQSLVQATRPLRELTAILGLFRSVPTQRGGGGDSLVPKLMQLFIELRADARAKKDFATGDKIRNELAALGITLEDRKGETSWRSGQ